MAWRAGKCLLQEVWMVSAEAFIERTEIKSKLPSIAPNTWGKGKKFEEFSSL